jgi:hypothetical protein
LSKITKAITASSGFHIDCAIQVSSGVSKFPSGKGAFSLFPNRKPAVSHPEFPNGNKFGSFTTLYRPKQIPATDYSPETGNNGSSSNRPPLLNPKGPT